MILNSKRHKEAEDKGYKAFLDGKSIDANPYYWMGTANMVYSSLWEKGFTKAASDHKRMKYDHI